MIASGKREIPFTILLVPFLAGLCLDITIPCISYLSIIKILSGLLFVVFIALNFLYRRLNVYKFKWTGGLSVAILLFFVGIMCLENNRENNLENHFSKVPGQYLIGKISNEPTKNSGVTRFILNIEQSGFQNTLKQVNGKLMVTVKTDSTHKHELLYGDELLLPANYVPIQPPLNPAEFNYKSYLAHQNIYQQAFFNQKTILVIAKDRGNPMVAYALTLRKQLVNKLRLNMHDTDAVAIASTIILGYRNDLRKDTQQAYAKTGTMHLLSVAGMHVGFIYLIINLLLGFLARYPNGKLIKIAVSITLIWCYALITGFSPAVCRAVLMLSMVIIGFAFNRHINKLNVLAVSAFILLLYNPFYILDAGFQLSYIAVFGIILIQPFIYKWVRPKNWLVKEIWLVISVSIAAQIVLCPLGALYFHDFPLCFLISNIFVVVPAALTMYLGIIYLALPTIPMVSVSLAWCLNKTVIIMTKTLLIIEHTPFSNISKIWLTPAEFILAYAIIIITYYGFIKANKVLLKFSLVSFLLICISFSTKKYNAYKSNTLTFFSLRNKTGILFKDGNAATLLTNLGETDKAYQYSIQPYLDSCKINSTHLIDCKTDYSTNFFTKRGNLIQFNNKKLLILDRSFVMTTFPAKLNVDYIYLMGYPNITLQYLKQNYNFKLLIADGNNSNLFIKNLKNTALLTNDNF